MADSTFTHLLCRSLSLLIWMASPATALAFEPLQKSFDETPVEASLDLNVEDVDFSVVVDWVEVG